MDFFPAPWHDFPNRNRKEWTSFYMEEYRVQTLKAWVGDLVQDCNDADFLEFLYLLLKKR
jgi:hypothetical protein